mgnify:CR=1 FL=1
MPTDAIITKMRLTDVAFEEWLQARSSAAVGATGPGGDADLGISPI